MRRWVLAWMVSIAVGLAPPVCASDLERTTPWPIVLRMDKFVVEHSSMPSKGGATAKTATEVFWLLATAVLTFGLPLIDLPRVLQQGGAEGRSAQLCMDSWKEVLQRPQSWLKPAEAQDFALQTIRVEATRLLAGRAQPVAVEVATSGKSDAQRRAALREIGIRLSSPSLFVADVAIVIEPLPSGCTASLRAQAILRLEPSEASGGDSTYSLSQALASVSKAETVDVHAWASEPEVGSSALRLALVRLSDEIVQAYSWQRGDEAPPPSPASTSGEDKIGADRGPQREPG